MKKPSRRLLLVVIVGEILVILVIFGWLLSWRAKQVGDDVAEVETLPQATLPDQAITATSSLTSPSPAETLPSSSPSMQASKQAFTLTPSLFLTATPSPDVVVHPVQEGETLSKIAGMYDVTIDELLELNPEITNPDQILPGQRIVISGGEQVVDLTTPESPVTATSDTFQAYSGLPSLISHDATKLNQSYPLVETVLEGQLIIHYQPEAYTDQHEEQISGALREAYRFVEDQIGLAFESPLNLYLAGSLFEDQESLRGFTQSGLYRSFLLVDGSGNLDEQTYLFAHEFTHIFAYHQWGRYHSPMIHEGLATYLPQKFLGGTDYLALEEICTAMKAADRLVPMASLAGQTDYGLPYFAGHIRSFLYYNQSACFVKYLVDQYGFEPLTRVFSSGDYQSVYGKSLADLDAGFQARLSQNQVAVEPLAFVNGVEAVAAAYEDYFDRTQDGQHAHFEAYMTLDAARMAVNQGDVMKANQFLEQYDLLVGR